MMRRIFIALTGLLALSACSTISGISGLLNRRGSAAPEPVAEAAPTVVTDHSADALTGRWMIVTVGSKTVTDYDEDWPYIEFAPSEGRFYGGDGCNVINGDFAVAPGQLLRFDHMAATMRLCPDDTLAYPIASAIDATRSFSLVSRDGAQILNLHNARHLTVMTLRNTDLLFLDGPWRVKTINGENVTNPDVKLIFDIGQGQFHGHTGCNLVNGQITQDPQVASSVQFSSLTTTLRACPPGDNTEQELLIALEETATARSVAADCVELLSPSGRVLITLTKLDKSNLK